MARPNMSRNACHCLAAESAAIVVMVLVCSVLIRLVS